MSATQQQIVNALTVAFGNATGLDVYDTFAPDDSQTPYGVILVQSDEPENALGNTAAHNITFEFVVRTEKRLGPAVIREYGDDAYNALQLQRLTVTDDPGQNSIECRDRGGVALTDTNFLTLTQTWFYQGGF